MARHTTEFQTIRSQGGLLPPDLLRRILDPKEKLDGTRPEDYTLAPAERLNEVITQSWNRLSKYWNDFRAAAAKLPPDEPATGLTNDKWTLPVLRELGFGLLPTTAGPEINGRTYPISRFFGPVPIHLVGCGLSLDRRAAGVRGAASSNPHGLVQELLNRSSGHLWGIVSNGLQFRILRDSQALSRQSFLEFDLEAMFSGEVYSDFALLWMTAHATRFAPREENRPDTCWLERWTKIANEQGTRALLDLRGGVERALACLGEGFTSHPRNVELRDALRSGQLSLSDFHGQLLRIVYRLIFLFVAEDRSIEGHRLLHAIVESPAAEVARQRYASYYSLSRLREMASRMKGSRHADLWRQFHLVSNALSGLEPYAPIREQLALPALGSFLWSPQSTAALNSAEITNHDFLDALRNLAFTRQGSALRPVDYKNLGAEELGGVYETLLALTPQISADGARFTFAEFAGNERKTSGSYYTPDSLVQCLLDSALDPVVEQAIKGKSPAEAEKAILALKVCDPAVGSGHFLVGAAHRLARHLAVQRSLAQGESEPSPLHYQHALRDVIGRCLYGVDINPMSAELCRVSLWLEALEPGKPLSFLDHHIQVGNSLLGATPALLAKGIPDEAFAAIEGDDKEVCARFKRVNRDERQGQQHLFAPTTEPWERLGDLAVSMAQLDVAPDDSLESVQEKQRLYEDMVHSGSYLNGRFWADAWCAAFVWKKTSEFKYPITEEVFRRIENNPHGVDAWMRDEIMRLANQYKFFHWHVAFPDVFGVTTGIQARNEQMGWAGGFDVVLGNPPWERVTIRDNEWFADRVPEISSNRNATTRNRLIADWKEANPEIFSSFTREKRQAASEKMIFRDSGLFPLSGCGDVNLFALFAERSQSILGSRGSSGLVLPTGIATAKTTAPFFESLAVEQRIASIYDFDNRGGAFPAVQGNVRFCLLTTSARGSFTKFKAASFVHSPEEILIEGRTYWLGLDDLRAINPNTLGCPMFTSAQDAELVKFIFRNTPIFLHSDPSQSPWHVEMSRMFHMGDDSHLFWSRERLLEDGFTLIGNKFQSGARSFLPLYESKLAGQFNHRASTFEGMPPERRFGTHPATADLGSEELSKPECLVIPRYWMAAEAAESKLRNRPGFLSFRNAISATADSRSLVATILPRYPAGDSLKFIYSAGGSTEDLLLAGCLNTFCVDYVLRQKASGGNASLFIIEQLPVVRIPNREQMQWLIDRLIELTYTAWDLQPFGGSCGFLGSPFRWDEERRLLLRCEIDAALFSLYFPPDARGGWRRTENEPPEDPLLLQSRFATPRHAVSYVMDTFPIVKRKEEEKYGEYRTKLVILEIYDAMVEAMRTGIPYQTRLDPPPADPSCRHPKKKTGILAYGSLITDPGSELEPRIGMRIKTQTPFPVEYGRISGTRGGAPTLVPHEAGAPVTAEILVLDDDISVEEARNMLWRRETRQEGSGKTYPAGAGENSVLVRDLHDDPCVETVLYTDFNSSGKLPHPIAADLAKRAIESVGSAEPGMDGISYLISATKSGIHTPLTDEYRAEILRQSGAGTLQELLQPANSMQ